LGGALEKGGGVGGGGGVRFGLYKIFFYSKVAVHESIMFLANISLFGHPTPPLYRPRYGAIYYSPQTPLQ